MKAILTLGLAALVACEPEPTSVEFTGTRLMVHALLHAGADTVSMLVTRVRGEWPGSEAPSIPVTNAHVRLIQTPDTFTLVTGRGCVSVSGLPDKSDLNNGCYSAVLAGGVRAGALYELEIDIAGEPPVRGSVRVPEMPVFLAPAPGIELPSGTPPVFVRWSYPETSPFVELRLRANRPQCNAAITTPSDASPRSWLMFTGVDSATVGANVTCDDTAMEREAARLTVTVYDTAYTRFFRLHFRAEALHLRDAAVGITGAIGVFGAAASASIPVVVVRTSFYSFTFGPYTNGSPR
ncbi:MAG: hypothetical protein ACREMA_13830, partial [Longimicrobiales bacterium]